MTSLSTTEIDHKLLLSNFQRLKSSAPIQELLKERNGVFFAQCAITFLYASCVVWLTQHWIVGIKSTIVIGVLAAFASGKFGTLGHDVGHRQAFKSHKHLQLSMEILLGPISLGFSSLWWIAKHVVHHNFPNLEGRDKDINLPVPSSAHQARERGLNEDSFIVKHAWWILPLLLPFQAMDARRSSIRYLIDAPQKQKDLIPQWIGLAIHFALYGWLIASIGIHTGWNLATVFLLVHQTAHGLYNSSIFATNHKGMPIFLEGNSPGWVALSILTARNIRSGNGIKQILLTDWFGGLNYQIEHHLFPEMPRCNLRHAVVHVKQFCKENNLEYYETGFWRSYKEVFLHFKKRIAFELIQSPMGA